MNYSHLRSTLRAGSVVFGISAIFLLVLPALFLDLLGLKSSDQLIWSMRMIGITVFALAGNMWNNSKHSDNQKVRNVAKVMCVSAAALGILTLMIPTTMTWFGYAYAAIGFGFALSYLWGMFKKSANS